MTVTLPGTDLTRTSKPRAGRTASAPAGQAEVAIIEDAQAINTFFRDLIEFLQEFSSVPLAQRATGPSPRRVHRAAVRPEPAAETLMGRRPSAAAKRPVAAPAAAPASVEPGAGSDPAAVPAAAESAVALTARRLARRALAAAAAEGNSTNPLRVPPFVAKM